MKDLIQVWNRVAGRTYSAVNTGNQENNSSPLGHHESQNKFIKSKEAKRRRRFIYLIVASVLSLLTGIFIHIVHPYDLVFKYKSIFGEGGEIFEMWRKPEVELFLRVYLYNVTNAEEFMKGTDKKIKVSQVGPYVYKELIEHGNVTFNENGTLSTTPLHPLEWQPHLSYPHTEEDLVMLPNIAYLSIAHVGSQRNIFVRLGVNTLLGTTRDRPIVKMTAKEFMFGYATSLVTLGNNFLPGWIKFDKLGLIDRMYDFDEDFETIYTGTDEDETVSGLMDTWRGSRHLPHWGNTSCAQIHMASDGSKFRGKLKPNDTVLFYRKSLCRAAPLVKVDEGWKDGFFAYKYTYEKNALDNGHNNPENKCFCREGKCLQEGLIDVTDCYYGFPIALSYPHLLDADERILDRIEGMNPVEETHRSHLWIQPKSGLPLEVAVKFQINMALGNLDSMHGSKPFSNMVLPLLWFEFRMFSFPESMANKFKLYLMILPQGENILMWIGFLISGPLLAAAFLIRMKRSNTNKSKRNIIMWDDNSAYAKSLRKMSLDIEKSKMQSVYTPCELPLTEQHDSDSPFLNSSDKNTSESEPETEIDMTNERRPSLLRTQADKIKDMGINFGNKIQGNFDEISKNIRHLTNKLNGEKQNNSISDMSSEANTDLYQSSEEDQCNEMRRCSLPSDILGNVNYQMIESSDDDDVCNVEIVDDGSEFDPTTDEILVRRMSIENSNKIDRLNKLETETNV